LELQIGTRRVGEVTILDVAGELDLYTVPRLDEGLRGVTTGPGSRVVVNLTGVAYVDSTALKVLTDNQKRVRQHGGEIVLVASQPTIVKIFKITGLDAVLPTVATEGEAMQKIRALPPREPQTPQLSRSAAWRGLRNGPRGPGLRSATRRQGLGLRSLSAFPATAGPLRMIAPPAGAGVPRGLGRGRGPG